jgi:hypothetical protein
MLKFVPGGRRLSIPYGFLCSWLQSRSSGASNCVHASWRTWKWETTSPIVDGKNCIGSQARRNKCCDLPSLTLSIFLAPSLVSTCILVYFVGSATGGRRSTTGYCVHLVGHSTSFRSGHAGSGSHPYEFHFPPCSVFCVSDPRDN